MSPLPDDIREFKVQSHNDDAQFGYVTGGTVNVVTKSGTNEYHGAIWEYLRNNALDARNPFTTTNTELRQNQFGGNIGGPVIIPHLYQARTRPSSSGAMKGSGKRRARGITGLAITPTATQLGGDLSNLSAPIYNPFSTHTGPNGTPVRDPFAGNIIPAPLIDPNMAAYAKAVFPAPGPPILGQYNTAATGSMPKNQDQFNIRADEYLTTKDSLWFRYSSSNQSRLSNAGFQNLNDNGETDGRNWGINYLHTFNPTTLVNIVSGHDRLDNTDDSLLAGVNAAELNQKTGFDPAFGCGYKQWGGVTDCLVPAMNISGLSAAGKEPAGATL